VDELAILQNGKLAAKGSVQALREQVDLPLRVEVQLKPGAAPLLEGLHAIGFNGFLRDQRYVEIDCPRKDKMRLLAWLTERSGQVGDIQLKEPTLEDVFMGYKAGPR
jgi:Cu-processing system ATP-binding protein